MLEKTERPIKNLQFRNTGNFGHQTEDGYKIINPTWYRKIKRVPLGPTNKLVNPGTREGKSVPVSYKTPGKYILSDRGKRKNKLSFSKVNQLI